MAKRIQPMRIDSLSAQGSLDTSMKELDTRPNAQYQDYSPYVTDLATKLFSLLRIDDPDFSLSQDIASIEKIRRDAIIQQLVTYRKHLVAGREWHLEPFDDSPDSIELSGIIEWLIKQSENFTISRFRISDAIFLGLACEKMVMKVDYLRIPGAISKAVKGKILPWFFIDRFLDIDKRRLRKEYKTFGNDSREYYWTIFNVHDRLWKKMTNQSQYIMHLYNNEEDTYGYGRGLNEAIFYYWRGKAFLLKYAQQFCEAFAKPWIRAKINELKGVAENIESRARKWINILEKMRGSNVIVGGAEDDFDFMTAPTSGQQVLMELIKYFDDALTMLIIGSTLAVKTAENGNRALGEVHESTTETLVNYDRQILQETYTRTLVKALYEANYSLFESLGFGDTGLPRFVIDRKVKEDPLQVFTQVQLGQQIGMQFSEEEVAKRSGWPIPKEGQKVLRPINAMGDLGGLEEPEGEENKNTPVQQSSLPPNLKQLALSMQQAREEAVYGKKITA